MKTHKIILSLVVMTVSSFVLANETKYFTNFTTVDANGVPIVVTNQNLSTTANKQHEMLIEVTHYPTWRSYSDMPNTNGKIIVRESGPYQSNGYPHWVAPYNPGVFKVSLRGEQGELVSLTEQGKHFGKAPATLKADRLYNHPILFDLGTNQPVELTGFDIDDIFFIQYPGKYELEMTPQLYWQATPGVHTLYLTNLPPIKLTIPLKSNVPSR